MRISGDLRSLHLSTPTVLATFSTHDVLMMGVGVLVSHMVSASLLAIVLAVFVVDGMREAVNRVVLAERRLGPMDRAFLCIVALGLLLASRFWEGTLYVALVCMFLLLRYHRRQALGRGHVFGLLVAGLVCVGLLGSYLHAPPLQKLTAQSDRGAVSGYLVGQGDKQDWLVAVDTGHEYVLQRIGGGGEEATDIRIHPAQDHDYQIAMFWLADHL